MKFLGLGWPLLVLAVFIFFLTFICWFFSERLFWNTWFMDRFPRGTTKSKKSKMCPSENSCGTKYRKPTSLKSLISKEAKLLRRGEIRIIIFLLLAFCFLFTILPLWMFLKPPVGVLAKEAIRLNFFVLTFEVVSLTLFFIGSFVFFKEAGSFWLLKSAPISSSKILLSKIGIAVLFNVIFFNLWLFLWNLLGRVGFILTIVSFLAFTALAIGVSWVGVCAWSFTPDFYKRGGKISSAIEGLKILPLGALILLAIALSEVIKECFEGFFLDAKWGLETKMLFMGLLVVSYFFSFILAFVLAFKRLERMELK